MTTDAPSVLPPEFSDLEPYADWALRTEAERYAKRLSSSMDELQTFYDVAFPRLDDAIAYIDQYEFNTLPPETASQRLAQELAAVTFKEYALQDGNTLEATQRMIESRAVTEFPLNDQEILLRHLHKTARDLVAEHSRRAEETPVRISAAV